MVTLAELFEEDEPGLPDDVPEIVIIMPRPNFSDFQSRCSKASGHHHR